MRIYFSGGTGLEATPEVLVPKLKPRIMLTFYDVRKSGTADRFKAFLQRKKTK